MANRVNLSINQELLKEAKIYALKQGKSLSAIFEEFLRKLLKESDAPNPESHHNATKAWLDDVRGSIKDSGANYDDLKLEYLKEKYLK